MLKGFGLFKTLSMFGVAIMIFILFGPALIQIGHAAQNGDWTEALTIVGGRLFAIEQTINEETNYLLETDDAPYQQIFHLTYVITLLFMIFFAIMVIFNFMNWLSGKGQLTPSTDIIIVILIILSYLLIEFLYSYFILGATVIPIKDGVFYFIKNSPIILNKIFF